MVRNYRQLWNDVASAANEAQAIQTLARILADKEGRFFITLLDGQDADSCTEILGNGIISKDLTSAEKHTFFLTLRRLAERRGRLPDRMRITEGIVVLDEILDRGGFGDVRSGTYRERFVAIKTLRVSARDDFAKIKKRFFKEVVLWSTLSHPNILKLAGVQEHANERQLTTVSELMAYGNVMEYIENHHVNRLKLLHGAADGLKYLHGARLAHGDLKGSNILISNDIPPRACLADFGFMTVIPEMLSCSAQTEGGTAKFMPPEHLVPEVFGQKGAKPTPQADIYAFGMVIFQVLTGKNPFPGIKNSAAVGYYVLRGKRPDKPENAPAIGFSDSLWDFTQRCWDGEMGLRPKVGEVVTHLEDAAAAWNELMPPSSPVDDVTADSEVLDSEGSSDFEVLSPL